MTGGDQSAAHLPVAPQLEESGLPPSGSKSNAFGGGRGPNSSFDDVLKNTEQEQSFSFLG